MTQEPIPQPVTMQISFDWLRLISIALAGIGLLSVLPFAWALSTHAINICPFNSGMDCELVVRSVYSRIGPLPVSYLGVFACLLILATLLLESHLPFGRIITFGLTLAGFLVSAYLIAVEALVLHIWCQVCTQIVLAIIGLFVVSFVRMWRVISTIPSDDEAEDETA